MLNLSQPIHLYRSRQASRAQRKLWVCEWQSTIIASVSGGVFLVEAGHPIDARQTAKKMLRDVLAGPLRFTFTIRLATLDELDQVKLAPAGAILEMKTPAPASAPGGKHFADRSSADSTSKT